MTEVPLASGRSSSTRDEFGDGRMHIGLAITPSSRSIHPATLARLAEERGFRSLFCSEHTHIPVPREIDVTAQGWFQEGYRSSMDPLTWLAAAAAATTKLWVGTGIALIAQHDPIALAKQIATVDVLSGGRLILGFGFGWNVEEMKNHGIDPRKRRAIAREHMLLMQRLWTDDEAEFHGEHVDLTRSWSWPKPIQAPYPTVLLGAGASDRNLDHLAEYCDGWLAHATVDRADLTRLRERAEAAGRDPDSIRIAVHRATPDAANLEKCRELGANSLTLSLTDGTADDALRALDEHTALVEKVFGATS